MARRKNIKGQIAFDLSFRKTIDDFNQEEIDQKLRSKAIKRYRKKTIKAGKMIEVEIYPIWDTKVIHRGKKINPTSEEQEKINDKNQRKRIERKIFANFGDGDQWITLGYGKGKEPKTLEEAKKNLSKYLRSLNTILKKQGKPNLKYIAVTERSGRGRYHHHIICDFEDRDLAEKKWIYGKYPQARRIKEEDGSIEGLAKYITKDIKSKQSIRIYSTSRGNLKEPIITIADTEISKRRAEMFGKSEQLIIEYMEKKFPMAKYLTSCVRFSDYADGAYIYTKLIRRE